MKETNQSIKVIGIDPAPKKGLTIFDGANFCQISGADMKEYLGKAKRESESVLICWDAPLSFNENLSFGEKCDNLYTRIIENFFKSKLPKEISILGYAGCPHWTISQYLLGYPKISPFDEGFTPPFNLVFDKGGISKSVTEVHPAVAIWLWLKDSIPPHESWSYKSSDLDAVIDALNRQSILPDNIKIKNDDYLDAYIAWKLGRDWINGQGVCILGDNHTGSFLLPYNEEIFNDFALHTNKTTKC